MRVHIYVHAEELEYLDKIIKGKAEAGEYKVTISPIYFKDSYLIDMPYSDFVRLNDQKTFTSLISL
jgi:hypothetical protein